MSQKHKFIPIRKLKGYFSPTDTDRLNHKLDNDEIYESTLAINTMTVDY